DLSVIAVVRRLSSVVCRPSSIVQRQGRGVWEEAVDDRAGGAGVVAPGAAAAGAPGGHKLGVRARDGRAGGGDGGPPRRARGGGGGHRRRAGGGGERREARVHVEDVAIVVGQGKRIGGGGVHLGVPAGDDFVIEVEMHLERMQGRPPARAGGFRRRPGARRAA